MKEIRLSVCYPMPLNLELDRTIQTYAEHYGFKFLGSGSDGYSRDLEFRGSDELLDNPNLLLLFSLLLKQAASTCLYSAEAQPLAESERP